MHRFFIAPETLTEKKVVIAGQEAHHLRSVLRLSTGDRICLLDGIGGIHEATITRITKQEVQATIISSRTAPPPSGCIHIGQALLKGKKMDLVIQKANELGIDVLEPFVSLYSDSKSPQPERAERWRRIILESCKQCGRPVPLDCRPEADFESVLAAGGDFELKLVFWEEEQEISLTRVFENRARPRSAKALIGPEGGFSQAEIELARAAGFQPVSLGDRILRAETASLAVMAILQHRLGNLG